ncbi:hypothetical protein GPDM_10755 [Planococcus donghaensis MPA1U2]|uniref:DUF3219 domain-containing protein n=1 Tax=Planococcus donghaensis MPA1U2 TaxID=933115 RepID=E7RI43_9BACL|nr:DUF3219 family protein [Planococcus donghaensis]EGA89282.1 hypothetical protein GPDM_10755 [Planococcus donghaensis MPA1U2]
MTNTIIWIDDTEIHTSNFKEETNKQTNAHQHNRKIAFNFNVASEEYHHIATLLYKMNFRIRIPSLNAEFNASITDYSTSITDLYKPNQVADYHLELTEVN